MSPKHIEGGRGALHWLFESTLLLKSVFALFEIAAGLGLWLVPHQQISGFAGWLTRNHLIEGHHGPIYRHFSASLAQFSMASQHFYAFYLLGHGAIKLAIVILLMRKVAFAYPLGIVVFSGFILLQMHRWMHTHSVVLLALSVLDVTVVWLTWHEWRESRG